MDKILNLIDKTIGTEENLRQLAGANTVDFEKHTYGSLLLLALKEKIQNL